MEEVLEIVLNFVVKMDLVTELWLHLGSGSDDLATVVKKGKSTSSVARWTVKKGGFKIDKAGFGR